MLSFPRNGFSHGSEFFPVDLGLFLFSNSQMWSKRFSCCFLVIPSHYPPMACHDMAAKHLSCSPPPQAHYFCSVIFRKVDDFPPCPLSLTCKSFPVPQINQKQHELEDVRCEEQDTTPTPPISLILSLVLSLGNFLTHNGFHIVTSVSCVFWTLTDLQPLCSTEVKSEER